MSGERRIVHVTRGMPAEDGAGVKLTRLIGTPEIPDLDPILMLDNFGSDDPKAYIAGFPPHPHRGFETVSYMISGSLRHKDNKGGEGLITDGGVQWMTAGRGVVHRVCDGTGSRDLQRRAAVRSGPCTGRFPVAHLCYCDIVTSTLWLTQRRDCGIRLAARRARRRAKSVSAKWIWHVRSRW